MGEPNGERTGCAASGAWDWLFWDGGDGVVNIVAVVRAASARPSFSISPEM